MTVRSSEGDGTSGSGSDSQDLAPRPGHRRRADGFDDAIVVTRVHAWLGLTAALLLVAGVVVWATTTEVNQTIVRPGAALVNGTLSEVGSPARGFVESLDVAVGSKVHVGQEVGTVVTAAGTTDPVVARVSGKVVQVLLDVGSPVVSGATIIALAQTSGSVVVRTFVSAAESQEIHVGTRAIVDFPGAKSVDGTVTFVGDIPLTTETAAASLGSLPLADLLDVTSGSVSVEVTPSTSWTRTFDGFDVATVTLLVGSKRPIDYVI